MIIFNQDSSLSEIIFRDQTIIPVFNRFGITLGVGDDTVATACEKRKIDIDFFLTVVNTYLNDNYFPERKLKTVDKGLLLDYLKSAGEYFSKVQMPNIERHLELLIRNSSGCDNNLAPLQSFFKDLCKEVQECLTGSDKDNPLSDRWFAIEEKVSDLASFFVIHLRGDYNHNLCMAVVNAIFMLEKDLRQNNRLRRRLFNPILAR